jgi:hypothetical protein
MEFSTILFHAHSGVRYLVLLAGVVAFLYTLIAAIRARPWDRTGRILLAVFTGVLDLQILLGLVLVFLWRVYPALWGHITIMVLAGFAAHAPGVLNRKRMTKDQTPLTAALGVAGALILIVAGIAAIQRSIL